jgi:methylated-DNA-[protein]-cysteine S-methyltransferase
LPSPVGLLTLAWDDSALRALDFDGFDSRFHALLAAHYGEYGLAQAEIPEPFRAALEAYFAGDLAAIGSIPVRTAGTPFQEKVWAGLREIPAGMTISYSELAARLGNPAATRAVGRANGANPVGIVVPCHRVIGSNGSLTGYGGGMHRKRWLLEHERAHLPHVAAGSEPVQRSLSSMLI